ncbi:MAG: TetR family transcriptional regulator [Tetrasphaera sp.]
MHERAQRAEGLGFDPVGPDGALPEVPQVPLTLRERRKATTMRRVQTVAVDLFDVRGFDAVTIEEVAAAAEVSPSTIYRYFGTKERLVLHDEYDDLFLRLVPVLLAQHDPVTATEKAMALLMPAHLGDERMIRRVQLWFDHPAIRAAGYLLMDEMADDLAQLLAASPRHEYTLPQARVVVGALVGGLITAIRDWHESGGDGDLTAMIADGVQAMRRAFGGDGRR